MAISVDVFMESDELRWQYLMDMIENEEIDGDFTQYANKPW